MAVHSAQWLHDETHAHSFFSLDSTLQQVPTMCYHTVKGPGCAGGPGAFGEHKAGHGQAGSAGASGSRLLLQEASAVQVAGAAKRVASAAVAGCM